ncbi:DinB family protein [Deinococcus sp.]|uniref:DinB family protein n=1 Tax=Deinococcus sp. TaxID=47478 RepID=UPI003C7EC5AD
MTRPDPTQYPEFHQTYVRLVPEEDLLAALEKQAAETKRVLMAFLAPDHVYAPDKWTVRQVVGHMTDTERLFGGRLVWAARGDPANLPRSNPAAWMEAAHFERYTWSDLVAEFALVRAGHLSLLRHLTPDAWERIGTVNGSPFSVRALAYVLLGHERHHLKVLQERYS